jgi:hypothetical protein
MACLIAGITSLESRAQDAAPAGPSDVSAAPAQTETPAFTQRPVDIWSDGTRISGDFFAPVDASADAKLPTLLLCHGWGGLRSHLNAAYAPRFAAAGFNVLTFDYRGWGDSDSRLVLKQDQPKPGENGEATVKVQIIREVVDPYDQLEDIQAALDFLEGEPTVDMENVGLWGTSYGGGHVVWTAAHDDRVSAIVSQVGAMNSTLAIAGAMEGRGGLEFVHSLGIKRARGAIEPVPQDQPISRGLRGTPILEKVAEYRPVDFVDRIEAPLLIIDVENEELFDISENGRKVYDLVKDRVPSKYHLFEATTHYQVYSGEPYREASELALDWFNQHLR